MLVDVSKIFFSVVASVDISLSPQILNLEKTP
jgi:hypothetical protein